MANRSEVGRRSRSKGKRGELSLVHALNPGRTPFPAGWRHSITEILVSASTGRQHHGGPDSPDIRHNIPGVHIECTHREDIGADNSVLKTKLEQACRDAPHGTLPIVVWKRNREPWRVSFFGGLIDWLPQPASNSGECKPVLGSSQRHVIYTHEVVQMSLPGFLRSLGYESIADDELDSIPMAEEDAEQQQSEEN